MSQKKRANKSVESYKMGRADAAHFEPHSLACAYGAASFVRRVSAAIGWYD
jgi:hypothetical protein